MFADVCQKVQREQCMLPLAHIHAATLMRVLPSQLVCCLQSKTPLGQWNIHHAVNMWCNPSSQQQACAEFGEINEWDVTAVTDMSRLFMSRDWQGVKARSTRGKKNFNDDISAWDVSSVTSMESMFQNASSFNQPLEAWDVSNVRDMSNMFRGSSGSHSHPARDKPPKIARPKKENGIENAFWSTFWPYVDHVPS